MTIFALCRDGCNRWFPCLADPGRRSSLGLKAALVLLHLVYAGVLFLFDSDLIDRTRYTGLYVLFFIATLIQYFVTAGSSPGSVLDAMRAINEKNAVFHSSSVSSKQPASSIKGSLDITIDHSQSGRSGSASNIIYWAKIVSDMYPPGTPVRWYICEETALCLWTAILFLSYSKTNITRAWWKDAIMIIMLVFLFMFLIFLFLLLIFHSHLILTNQTTYELVRRRRIPYLRGIPERVYPFSKGVCRNVYNFFCAKKSIYNLERLPTSGELEEKYRPYTCLDFLTCRCCC